MNIRKHYPIMATLLAALLILSACAAPAPMPAPTQVPPTIVPTQAPTQAPTQVPPTTAPTQVPPTAEPTKAPEPAASQNTPRLRQLDFSPFDAALAAFTADRAAQIEAIVKDADLVQVQDAVKAGKLTYAELTLYFLSRIQQYDETLRTMVELNPDALKEAQAADQLRKDGKTASAMLGIPVTLKDNIETAAPLHTTGGSEILLNHQPQADASFVKQLREAGAVILGKANLSEFAGGIAMLPPGASAVGGVTLNPHGDFSAGGSSSGSAAGTAAYETMVSVGSETAGSLIIPSSWNGVVGMYPGKGVVEGSGVIPLIKNNDSAGPIGRTVKDVAALLSIIDTTDTDYVAGLNTKALDGVKAAFLKADVLAQPTSPLEDTADNAAIAQVIEQSLAKAGVKVSAIELAPAQIGAQLNGGLSALIAGGVRHDMLPYLTAAGAPVKTPEDLAAYNLKDSQTRIPFQQGTLDSAVAMADMKDAATYQEGVTQVKAAAVAALEQAFASSRADVLVSVNNYHSQVYATANYPAISVPLGERANGMPVGVTLIGKPGSEAKLLAYAYALEQATKLRVDPDLSKLSMATSSATETQFGKAWQSVPCDSINIAKNIGAVADCGYVTVPENRAKGGDKTIQLAVARVKSTSQQPGAPVLLGTGGPGGYGFTFVQSALQGGSWLQDHTGILADRDYVLFTQRGTTGSQPTLNCPDYDVVEFQTALEGWNEQQVGDAISKTLTACRDKFAAQGVDFSAYNSNENAADIDDIRQALGYDKIIYYGQSYGTLLGQFLMRNHPEILDAVILDGVAGATPTTYAEMVDLQFAFRQLFAACQADAECNANYPNLENTLTQVYDSLQKKPQPLVVALGNETATLQINGDTILNGLIGKMYGGGADVPSTIAALKANSPIAIKALAPSLPSPLNPTARIMHFAINCSDDPIASVEPAQKDLLPMYANMARADNLKTAVACQVLNVPHLPEASDVPVASDLPVLVLNGSLDPATPTMNGQAVAETLPNSQMVVITGGGHVQDGNTCARSIMQAFMENPTAKVDISCIAPKPNFLVPTKAEVKTDDGKATVSLTLPGGFGLKEPNRWVLNGGTQNIIVKAFPAGTSAEDAMNAYLKTVPFDFKGSQMVDGPKIAGNPTKVLENSFDFQGSPLAVKYYAIEGKQGTFVVAWLNADPASEADYQKVVLEPIVQSIKISQ
jgi:amidase